MTSEATRWTTETLPVQLRRQDPDKQMAQGALNKIREECWLLEEKENNRVAHVWFAGSERLILDFEQKHKKELHINLGEGRGLSI